MNVLVTSTPDVSKDLLNEVVKVLKSTGGIITFSSKEGLSLNQLSLINKKFKEDTSSFSLSFDELFGVMDGCRTFKENDKDFNESAYVVLLTTISNNDRWFSAYRGKNIFVDCSNWSYFTDKEPKYGIAHQIVENLFQSLIELKVENGLDPLIHRKSIGCINDYCEDKVDINLKFMTARICPSCMKRANEKINNPLIIIHIKRFLNDLRNEFMKEVDDPEEFLPPISVSEKGEITIGNLNVHFQPVLKSVYLYFLKNNDGVDTQLIFEKAVDIFQIYKKVKGRSARLEPIANMFGYSVKRNDFKERNPHFDRFESTRTRIKDVIDDNLGFEFIEYYTIDNIPKGDSNYYIIKLSPTKISLPPELV